MRFRTIISLVLSAACWISGYAQDLDTYFAAAVEQHPNLRAHYHRFEASLQRVAQTRGLPDPQLSIGVFALPVETRLGPQLARVSLQQKFPWFGTLDARAEVYRREAEATYQQFVLARNQLYAQVAAAYYPIYRVAEWTRLENEQLELLRARKNLATSQFRAGKAPLVDALEVDLAIAATETQLAILDEKRQSLILRFNLLLDRPAEAPVVVTDTLRLPEASPFPRFDSAWRAHPQRLAIERRVAAQDARVELARLNAMPQLGVGLDYVGVGKRTDASPPGNGRDALMPMVSLSLPVFTEKYTASRQEAALDRAALQAEEEAVENELRGAYERLRFEMTEQRARVQLIDRQGEILARALELAVVAYGQNGSDFETLLRLQQQLFTYQKSRIEALVGYHIARAELRALLAVL